MKQQKFDKVLAQNYIYIYMQNCNTIDTVPMTTSMDF